MPFDLDIFAPSRVTMPWVKSRAKGSWNPSRPMSASAFVKKRAYIRCRIACSTPPMYWSTAIHMSTAARSHDSSALSGSQ